MMTLGTRPEVGLALEYHVEKIMFNTYFNIAFGNTREDYQVVVDRQTYNTRVFMGVALGIDL
ncbi:MAG: hypothetical protein R6U64_10625, partial [Bacteroidales bacterium]